jgi:hypothetical protein
VIAEAVNAVRLHADWRPLVGLTSDDEGTLVAHNRDARAS